MAASLGSPASAPALSSTINTLAVLPGGADGVTGSGAPPAVAVTAGVPVAAGAAAEGAAPDVPLAADRS